MKKTCFLLFTIVLFSSCTREPKSASVVRLERDIAFLETEDKNLSDRLKTESDIGMKHEITTKQVLLKSRLERVKAKLEAEQARR